MPYYGSTSCYFKNGLDPNRRIMQLSYRNASILLNRIRDEGNVPREFSSTFFRNLSTLCVLVRKKAADMNELHNYVELNYGVTAKRLFPNSKSDSARTGFSRFKMLLFKASSVLADSDNPCMFLLVPDTRVRSIKKTITIWATEPIYLSIIDQPCWDMKLADS